MSKRTADLRGVHSPRLSSARAYRGPDRRLAATEQDTPLGRVFWVSAILLFFVWGSLSVAGTMNPAAQAVDASVLRALLEASTATLAFVTGALYIIRWRLSGEARPLWMGAALVWFGFATIALASLLPAVQPSAIDPLVLDWLRAGSRLSVIATAGFAAFAYEVDARLDVKRALAPLVVATAMATLLLQVVPPAGQFLVGAAEQVVTRGGWAVGSVFVVAAWMLVGVFHVVNGVRQRRPLYAWGGLMFLGLGLAEVTRATLLPEPQVVWSVAAELVRGMSLLCGLTGVTVELQRSFTTQRGNLMRTTVAALASEARMRAEHVKQREVAHEARNALTAIEGATKTLERYRDQLPPATREELTLAVSAEVARLQRLVSSEQGSADPAPFNVAEALAPVVTSARSQGMLLHVEVPEDLVALGRWGDTAQVVETLLENARRHAPSSPVAVFGVVDDGRVVVRVEDRGPGVREDERERIFQRGHRGAAADGRPAAGLGLYVSAELMREQDGELWVDHRSGGGASFALALPAVKGTGLPASSADLARAEPID